MSKSLLSSTYALPKALSQLIWSSNLILQHKLKDPTARLWDARKAVKHGRSRAVRIESQLHERSRKATTNFERRLPQAIPSTKIPPRRLAGYGASATQT